MKLVRLDVTGKYWWENWVGGSSVSTSPNIFSFPLRFCSHRKSWIWDCEATISHKFFRCLVALSTVIWPLQNHLWHTHVLTCIFNMLQRIQITVTRIVDTSKPPPGNGRTLRVFIPYTSYVKATVSISLLRELEIRMKQILLPWKSLFVLSS